MIDLQLVTDFVFEHFINVKVTNSGTHFLAKCVLCGDSATNPRKRRFNLDYKNGKPVYHCFNCGKQGSFLKLYSILEGIDIEQSKKDIYSYDPIQIKNRLINRKNDFFITTKPTSKKYNYILKHCIGLTDEVDGYLLPKYQAKLKEFYKDRKIPYEWKIYVCYDDEYKDRFIIPVYDDNDIIYFQARRFSGSSLEPKYINPSTEKESIIFNKDRLNRDKYIIIVEGLIDAMMIGDQGTSILGKEIKNEYLKELLSLTDTGIILMFDNDADGYKSLLKFYKNKYVKKVKYFIIPYKYNDYKDINNLVVKYEIENVYDFIVNNSKSYIQLRSELLRRNVK